MAPRLHVHAERFFESARQKLYERPRFVKGVDLVTILVCICVYLSNTYVAISLVLLLHKLRRVTVVNQTGIGDDAKVFVERSHRVRQLFVKAANPVINLSLEHSCRTMGQSVALIPAEVEYLYLKCASGVAVSQRTETASVAFEYFIGIDVHMPIHRYSDLETGYGLVEIVVPVAFDHNGSGCCGPAQ